jgi:hypothetical protein
MYIAQNEECADGLALVLLELEPGEQVAWTGRPSSLRPVVLQSVPKAIMGLLSLIFLMFWMFMVIRGGHNGWEKGRAVPPFPPHNVLIATIAGLWMMPFCVSGAVPRGNHAKSSVIGVPPWDMAIGRPDRSGSII